MTDPSLIPDIIEMVTSIVALVITFSGIALILLDNRKYRRDLDAVKAELKKLKTHLNDPDSRSR